MWVDYLFCLLAGCLWSDLNEEVWDQVEEVVCLMVLLWYLTVFFGGLTGDGFFDSSLKVILCVLSSSVLVMESGSGLLLTSSHLPGYATSSVDGFVLIWSTELHQASNCL